MSSNGVVVRKTEVIQEALRELRRVPELTTARLQEDYLLKRGIERTLQICVEAVVDIAHRIVSLEGRPPCSTGSGALDALEEMGILEDASVYREMVQFRNLVVHRYESVDNAILVDIVHNHLQDFENYVREVSRYEGPQS